MRFLQFQLAKLLSFSLTFILLSCGRESIKVSPSTEADIVVEGGRLTFKDKDAFDRTLNQLRDIATEERAAEWEKKFKYSSLRKYNAANRDQPKLEDMNLPISYKVLLNEDAECVIGKNIVWFNDGYVHYVEGLDENILKQVKTNPGLNKNKTSIVTKVYKLSDVKSSGSIGGNTFDARYQHEWAINCESGPWRKTVYELTSTATQWGPTQQGYAFDYTLFINVKLEWWRPNRGWQANAGEYRQITANLSGQVQSQCNVITPSPFSYNQSWYTSSNMNINLGNGRAIENNGSTCSGAINYSIYGSLYSEVYLNGTCNGYLQTESPYPISGYLWEY